MKNTQTPVPLLAARALLSENLERLTDLLDPRFLNLEVDPIQCLLDHVDAYRESVSHLEWCEANYTLPVSKERNP